MDSIASDDGKAAICNCFSSAEILDKYHAVLWGNVHLSSVTYSKFQGSGQKATVYS